MGRLLRSFFYCELNCVRILLQICDAYKNYKALLSKPTHCQQLFIKSRQLFRYYKKDFKNIGPERGRVFSGMWRSTWANLLSLICIWDSRTLSCIGTSQCDHMARLIVQYLAIYNDENVPKIYQIYQSMFKSLPKIFNMAKII